MKFEKARKVIEFIVSLLSFLLKRSKKEESPPDNGVR